MRTDSRQLARVLTGTGLSFEGCLDRAHDIELGSPGQPAGWGLGFHWTGQVSVGVI